MKCAIMYCYVLATFIQFHRQAALKFSHRQVDHWYKTLTLRQELVSPISRQYPQDVLAKNLNSRQGNGNKSLRQGTAQ